MRPGVYQGKLRPLGEKTDPVKKVKVHRKKVLIPGKGVSTFLQFYGMWSQEQLEQNSGCGEQQKSRGRRQRELFADCRIPKNGKHKRQSAIVELFVSGADVAFHESAALNHTVVWTKKTEQAKFRLLYMVEVAGLEPTASASRTQRSTKLSHTSIFCSAAFLAATIIIISA